MNDEQAYWLDDGETGPPTIEDDAWFTHSVASLAYPRLERGPKPYPGQMTMAEVEFENSAYDVEKICEYDGLRITFPTAGLWHVTTGLPTPGAGRYYRVHEDGSFEEFTHD